MGYEQTRNVRPVNGCLKIRQPLRKKFRHLKLNLQISVLMIQRTTCLHSKRPMLSKPGGPGCSKGKAVSVTSPHGISNSAPDYGIF